MSGCHLSEEIPNLQNLWISRGLPRNTHANLEGANAATLLHKRGDEAMAGGYVPYLREWVGLSPSPRLLPPCNHPITFRSGGGSVRRVGR